MAVVRFNFFSNSTAAKTVTTSSGPDLIATALNPGLVALPDGGYLVVFSGFRPASMTQISNVRIQRMDSQGNRVGEEIFIAPDSQTIKGNASIAVAADGTIAVAWLEATTQTTAPVVRIQTLDRNLAFVGTPQTVAFSAELDTSGAARLSLAALQNGQFVVSIIANPTSVLRTVYNPATGASVGLDQFTANLHSGFSGPDTVVLSNGRPVTVVSRASSVIGSTELFDLANQRVIAEAMGPGATTNIINENQDVIALRDGGYAVAWTDTGYGQARDISLKVFNADGTARSSRAYVNTGFAFGAQFSPSLIELSNGYLVVSWLDGSNLLAAVFTSGGHRIDIPSIVWSGSMQTPETVTLSDGSFAYIWTAGVGIQSRVVELVRETQSNDQSEDLSGDSLRDLMLGAGGDDTLRGLGGDDLLAGEWGEDRLEGGDGNDLLIGGSGLDTLDGGNGSDTASYELASGRVSAYLSLASANTGEAFGDVYTSIENFIGSDFDDAMRGDESANRIEGGEGDDILGGAGGNDTLLGGLGSDTLNGEDGFDTLSYQDAEAGITIFLGGRQLNAGEASRDTYSSFEAITGSNFADILGGDAQANELRGEGGSDFLIGSGASDTLFGGAGNDALSGGDDQDRLDGGEGIDVAYYRDATSGVAAGLGRGGYAGEAFGDSFFAIENIWGSNFDDVLAGDDNGGQVYGFAGNDDLSGLAGDDFFYGGVGADTLTGGTGVDNFFFLSWKDQVNQFGTLEPYEGGDTFTDFTSGTDRIILSRFWFGFGNIGGPAAALTETHANFVTNGAVTTSRPSLIWNNAARTLSFDADGNGARAAVLIGNFQAGATLTLGDIWTA